nr:2196_t:CDS:2 [Entrophospora candida]
MKDLQEKGFGEKEGSMALTAQQVQEILADNFLNTNTPEDLLYRVFFRNATNFACHGGEHYNLRVDQFQPLPDGGLLFRHYCSKNNQRGIEGGVSQDIHLPPNSEAINDINKYLSKRSNGASEKFYLQINQLWLDLPPGILTNHSGRKTVAQILQDANVPEDAIMGVTGHKSIQGVRAYKEVNEKQHLAAMDTLIHAIEPSKSVLGDSTSINNSLNINNAIPEFSFDNMEKKFPIFMPFQ